MSLLREARNRSVFVLAVLCLLLALAAGRLAWLQVARGREPAQVAAWRAQRVVEVARRGDLLDARGGVLATSVREIDVRAWTGGLAATATRDDARAIADRLARLIGADPAETRRKLATPDRWVLLARGVRDPGAIAQLRDLAQRPGFRALHLETRFVREYPRGPLFAPLIGWVGWSDASAADPAAREAAGVCGLEARCESALRPIAGERFVRRDARQAEMIDPELDERPARDGRAVRVTLDPLAQDAVEQALDAAVDEFAPDWAQAVVVDPSTGGLVAVGQRPAPAAPAPRLEPVPAGASDAERARLAAANARRLELHQALLTQRVYPPGSSFKPLMLGLVLERGLAHPDTLVDCESGAAAFGGRVIHDVHPQAVITVSDVLVESSNIGMAKLVLSLVPADARRGSSSFQPIADHLQRLGFGARVGGMTGEENGIVPPLRSYDRNYTLASLAFGQQIQVTALQMASACAAIVNGGVWRAPRLLAAVEDEAGRFEAMPPLPGSERRVFSAATAAQLRGMLARVVDEGATRRFKPAGWSMGGKTGTAEDERDRSISICSYWCFAPAASPRFLALVVLYRPRKGRFAADNAGKVGATLMGSLLERYDVPRDRPEEWLARAPRTGAPLAGREHGVVLSSAVGEER